MLHRNIRVTALAIGVIFLAAVNVLAVVNGAWASVLRHDTVGELKGPLYAQRDNDSAVSEPGNDRRAKRGFLMDILKTTGKETARANRRLFMVLSNIKNIPADIDRALMRLTRGQRLSTLFPVILTLGLIFLVAWAIEKLFKRFAAGLQKQLEVVPKMEGFNKLWSALLKMINELLGIFIFTLSGLGLFVLFRGAGKGNVRLLFIASLMVILISRVYSALSNMLCSPNIPQLRLLTIGDRAAKSLHRNLLWLVQFSAFGFVTCMAFRTLGLPRDSFIVMAISFGSAVLLAIAVYVIKNRNTVARAILSGGIEDDGAGGTWLREQFAAIWHVLALIYLLLLWIFWAGRLIISDPATSSANRGVFFVSLLVVPIYLALDRLGQWVVTVGMGEAEILKKSTAEAGKALQEKLSTGMPDSVSGTAGVEDKRRRRRKILIVRRLVRVFIFLALAFWLLSFWGVNLPFGQAFTKATFDILITLVLAHLIWKVATNYINRKLLENMPEPAQKSDEDDEEWGSADTLGRGHTIFPMLRKFIGSVLVTLVAMTILSSIGVDIKPLLAGAGVVGLAIGFGARKLVSDIFSGFFFLIDDAFRIGEYLEAGKISGRVEKITLRNLFLRHHRGMLQIVPYSELGPVTNFMRGGLVIKFNLEFPYDTDIEKVRKVIKKVGQKMLADQEHGPSFIKPVKSQGVRNIGDSVMTIRVKFTAKPGKHFLIRREAYRLITEALEKQGIHYAHRKVIVDLSPIEVADTSRDARSPDEAKGETGMTDKPVDPKLTAAAGAAAFEGLKTGGKK